MLKVRLHEWFGVPGVAIDRSRSGDKHVGRMRVDHASVERSKERMIDRHIKDSVQCKSVTYSFHRRWDTYLDDDRISTIAGNNLICASKVEKAASSHHKSGEIRIDIKTPIKRFLDGSHPINPFGRDTGG